MMAGSSIKSYWPFLCIMENKDALTAKGKVDFEPITIPSPDGSERVYWISYTEWKALRKLMGYTRKASSLILNRGIDE